MPDGGVFLFPEFVMDETELDITALAGGEGRRFWLPVFTSGLGREYLRRVFREKEPIGKAPYALVVAESEDEARRWAAGCSDIEQVTEEQIRYRVLAQPRSCRGALVIRRVHGDPTFQWLTKTD